MKELVILGQGPAGISAALYAIRGGASVTIIAKDNGALEKADYIQNYYGFENGISAKDLIAQGIKQAENLGARFIRAEVSGIEFSDQGYIIKTTEGAEFNAGAVIIACGTSRNVPPIENIEKFEGAGVSYCAICDGFFFRGKKIAVIGSGAYAKSEYDVLKNIVSDVTILTNGQPPQFDIPCDMRKIVRFEGVFIACGSAGAFELSKKLGLESANNKIVVDENRATNIPGIFAAGDCVAGLQQIAKAVNDGMVAGIQALKYLKAN